jgi:hypothetical protein
MPSSQLSTPPTATILPQRHQDEAKSRHILRDMKYNSPHGRMLVTRKWREVAENLGETSKYFNIIFF